MPFSDAMLLVGPIMKKLTMLGIIGSAALLTAVPFTSKKENRRQPWVKITTTQRAPQEKTVTAPAKISAISPGEGISSIVGAGSAMRWSPTWQIALDFVSVARSPAMP
jgi:hypothetical protein